MQETRTGEKLVSERKTVETLECRKIQVVVLNCSCLCRQVSPIGSSLEIAFWLPRWRAKVYLSFYLDYLDVTNTSRFIVISFLFLLLTEFRTADIKLYTSGSFHAFMESLFAMTSGSIRRDKFTRNFYNLINCLIRISIIEWKSIFTAGQLVITVI